MISSQSTSKNDAATISSANNPDNSGDSIRFLTPSGPLFPFHHTGDAMFRAMNHGLSHGLQFPIYPAIHSMVHFINILFERPSVKS